jgi:hypothetical protein
VRSPAGPDELAAFETDVLAGFVLARAPAGLADVTIRSDVSHLEQVRGWFGRPLWDMEPSHGRSPAARLRPALASSRWMPVTRGPLRRPLSVPVDRLPDEVGMTDVACVLLDHVHDEPSQASGLSSAAERHSQSGSRRIASLSLSMETR